MFFIYLFVLDGAKDSYGGTELITAGITRTFIPGLSESHGQSKGSTCCIRECHRWIVVENGFVLLENRSYRTSEATELQRIFLLPLKKQLFKQKVLAI